MITGQADNHPPRMLHDPSGQIDQVEADRLHPLCDPAALKDQALHGRIEVMGKDRDPPPGGVLAELPGRKPSPRQVLLHDGVGLFGLAASFMMPVDELISFPIHVRSHSEELVLDPIESDCLEGEAFHGKVRLSQLLPDGDVAVGLSFLRRALVWDKTDLRPFSADASILIKERAPFFRLRGRFPELRGYIAAYGEFDPAEAFVDAPVAIGHEVVLISRRIRAEPDGLYPFGQKGESANKNAHGRRERCRP